jgi:hypothetical protein
VNAIPTKYAGVQFRSRLEARWAAFFDLLRFPWKYEPFDCNGYIPDFLLFDHVLLEVKPIVWGRPRHGEEFGAAEAKLKLERAFRDDRRFHWLAIVGVGIYLHHGDEVPSSALLGKVAARRIIDREGTPGDWKWGDLSLDWWPDNAELSLEAQPILGSRWDTQPDLEMLWREAGNRVQWRAPK